MNSVPDRRTRTFVAPRPNPPVPKPPVQPARVNAVPVTQNGRGIKCYDCQQWGHHRSNCPNKNFQRGRPRAALPSQEKEFAKTQGIPSPRKNTRPNQQANENYVDVSEEAEEQAEVYAALNPNSRDHQYTVLEFKGDYEGKPLTFLINSGSLHSFISPNLTKQTNVDQLGKD